MQPKNGVNTPKEGGWNETETPGAGSEQNPVTTLQHSDGAELHGLDQTIYPVPQ